MVANREVRREALAADLWPDHADPRQNLRVNLAYLQRVLQPDRKTGEAPYFLRADGIHLRLAGDEHLEVDVWMLEARLDTGDAADRSGSPAEALTAYRSAAELWRGEPYEDGPDAPWVESERVRLRTRFVASMLRSGELSLATGEFAEALEAGRHALAADRWSEPAHRLIIRIHLAEDNPTAAEHALAVCATALAELDLEPAHETALLLG